MGAGRKEEEGRVTEKCSDRGGGGDKRETPRRRETETERERDMKEERNMNKER